MQKQSNHSLKPVRIHSGRKPSRVAIRKFQNEIYSYYRENGRDLPWRKTGDPYQILVSEIMLQQTQVQRVMLKFEQFIRAFPDFFSLARASLRKILKEWQGMGYNRRALALRKIAQVVIDEYQGTLPASQEILMTFSGIGRATASAIVAFAYQQPAVFIETNIRRVFIHHFFRDVTGVKDAEILPLIEQSLDCSNPREWYYALMDYGVMLQQKCENPNRRSAHYQKQSPFHGSNRQLRGKILRLLVQESCSSEREIAKRLHISQEKLKSSLAQLVNEGFVAKVRGKFTVG